MKQVEEVIAAAEAADAGEDEVFGAGVRGDEVPADLRDRTSRRARLAAAKARLDAVDAARQAEYDAHLAERAAKEQAAGKKLRGRKPKPPAEKAPKTNPPKVNTTDPESRMMPIRNGWVQGYNAQAVATESQIIIACDVTQDTGDTAQLTPMIAAANRELDAAGVTEPIGVVLGDAGYCTEAVLAGLPDDGPDYYLAARNMRHGKPRVGSRTPARGRDADGQDGPEAVPQGRTGPLRQTQVDHRTCLRSDQDRQRNPLFHPPRLRRRGSRVEAHRRDPQPPQAPPPPARHSRRPDHCDLTGQRGGANELTASNTRPQPARTTLIGPSRPPPARASGPTPH